jgi:hexosaminidase
MLEPEGRPNILGFLGQLWSETVKGRDMLEYYYLPKMLGLAERAWSGQPGWGSIARRDLREGAADKAWNTFANALGRRELPRLDRLNGGYNYRLAPPGATVQDDRLLVKTAYPGMVVRYTTDGLGPTAESALYTGPVRTTAPVITLSTFDSRGRSSLPTVVDLRQD